MQIHLWRFDIPRWIGARTARVSHVAQAHVLAAVDIGLRSGARTAGSTQPEIGVTDLTGFTVDVIGKLGPLDYTGVAQNEPIAAHVNLAGSAFVVDIIALDD